MDPQQQQQSVPIPQEIRLFLESLIQQADIPDLDEQTKEAMIQELFYQLDQYLSSVIVNNLQEADLNEFIKMNEEKKPKEELEAFIQQRIPNAQTLFTDAFVEFRNLYLENVQKSKEQMASEQNAAPDNQTTEEKPF